MHLTHVIVVNGLKFQENIIAMICKIVHRPVIVIYVMFCILFCILCFLFFFLFELGDTLYIFMCLLFFCFVFLKQPHLVSQVKFHS